MQDETTTNGQQIGLYKDPASGQYLGAIDPIQAEAMVQQGWKLHTPGREAAESSEKDIATLRSLDAGELEPSSADPTSGKKGK